MTIANDTVIDTYGIDGQVHFELNEDFNLVSTFVKNGSDQEILVQDTPKELSNISNIDTLKKYLVKTHSKMSKYDDGSLHLDIYRKLDGGGNSNERVYKLSEHREALKSVIILDNTPEQLEKFRQERRDIARKKEAEALSTEKGFDDGFLYGDIADEFNGLKAQRNYTPSQKARYEVLKNEIDDKFIYAYFKKQFYGPPSTSRKWFNTNHPRTNTITRGVSFELEHHTVNNHGHLSITPYMNDRSFTIFKQW